MAVNNSPKSPHTPARHSAWRITAPRTLEVATQAHRALSVASLCSPGPPKSAAPSGRRSYVAISRTDRARNRHAPRHHTLRGDLRALPTPKSPRIPARPCVAIYARSPPKNPHAIRHPHPAWRFAARSPTQNPHAIRHGAGTARIPHPAWEQRWRKTPENPRIALSRPRSARTSVRRIDGGGWCGCWGCGRGERNRSRRSPGVGSVLDAQRPASHARSPRERRSVTHHPAGTD
jgi:hypothetical protein